ncbi:hypothetical protein [Streptomyces sp. NPDC048636]|uniref:hypothetical protein n=1 Tax=Streptomyces sp. NPDC048636 TaxID=3155762 RepID=UPI0034334CC9
MAHSVAHSPVGVPTVLSLNHTATAPLLGELRSARPFPAQLHRWGSVQAYERLLGSRYPMAVLDVPSARWTGDLEHRVRALSRIAAVSVLVPTGTDTLPLFGAHARNVLDRGLPARELAARLAADRRRLRTAVATAARDGVSLSPLSPPYRDSQRLLLKLLLSGSGPWCCHELRVLLGSAQRPLSRPTLHARVLRLMSYATAFRTAVHIEVHYGRTIYSTRP